jgi:hypothetical protein
MMSDAGFQSFAEFWPYYVREHSHPGTRLLHWFGTAAGAVLLVAAAWTGRWWLAILAPLVGYGMAWIGHFVIEHNRPATFTYPLWSFQGDLKMWALMLTGRMQAEVDRALAGPPSSSDQARSKN